MRIRFYPFVVVLCFLRSHGANLSAEDLEHFPHKRNIICYDRVGCFSDGPPFSGPLRPVTNPLSPNSILTNYLLYTRESPNTASTLDARHPDQFTTTWPNYKLRPTKIIVHGFVDNVKIDPWMKQMTDELLAHGDYNVIVVDWHIGNVPPYTQATGNTRLVGAQVADLVNTIQGETGQDSSEFHIIGHSLGSHVAGYAGEKIIGLGRISGLDPAGPLYENTDPEVRLDITDAVFVDIIHTDGGTLHMYGGARVKGMGMMQQVGHVDFYPNLGHDLPGCDVTPVHTVGSGLVLGTFDYIGCNHLRSIKLYTESINTLCPFLALPCTDEAHFVSGNCTSCSPSVCGRMGFNANQSIPAQPTKFYLTTEDQSPFCEYHVEISIFLNPQSHHERGKLKIRISGDRGTTGWISLNDNPYDFQPSGNYNFSIGMPSDIGHVTSLEFTWHHIAPAFNPIKWNILGLRHPILILDEAHVLQDEFGHIARFCANGGVVSSDEVITVKTQC